MRPLPESWVLLLLVMAGSLLGGLARALVSLLAFHLLGPGFPWGTLGVNALGSLAIALYDTLTGPDGRLLVGPRWRQFVMTGFCGGFTTFSVFSLETVALSLRGAPIAAALNVGLSVVVWITAAWAGHAIAVRLNRLDGR